MADTARVLARATEAFVDGAPIDWTALLARVGTTSDRALLERLRQLEAVRTARRLPDRPRAAAPQFTFGARLVIGAGCLQTAASLFVFAAAVAGAEMLGDRLPQLVLAVAFIGASIPLAIAAAREPGSLFLLATFVSSAAAFARSSLADVPGVWSSALRGVALEAFTPACLWQFAVDFPRVRRFARFDVLARRAAGAAWLAGALLFIVNMRPARAIVERGPVAYLLRDHASRLYWLFFALAVLPAVAVIFVRAHRAPPSERRKVVRFAFALAAGSAPFLLSGLTWAALPELGEWIRSDRLFNAISIAALTASPILSSVAVVSDGRIPVGVLFHDSFRSVLRRSVSTIGARTVDHDDRLARALDRIRLSRGARELAGVLTRELRHLVAARSVHVLVAENRRWFIDPRRDAAPLRSDSVLVAILAETTTPVDLSAEGRLRDLLPRSERDWVARHDVHIAAALKRRDGSVAAVVALDRKRDGGRFDEHDRRLVLTLLTAASATWGVDVVADAGHSSHQASRSEEHALECSRCGVVERSAPLTCGCSADVHIAALPATVSEKFAVRRRLGAGGMGVVYLARDLALDRDVVLKTLPDLQPDGVMRMREEARAMAALNHEALATIFGLEVWRRTPVLVVEYFPNGTLADRLRAGPLSHAEAMSLGIRLAGALAHMHANGRLHRDLKPSNIGVTASGSSKLFDFGLAMTLATRIDGGEAFDPEDEPAGFAGSLAYLPPEAYRGANPAASMDLWALSVTLLEALTREHPLASPHRLWRFRRFSPHDFRALCATRFSATPALHQFFIRALARRPEERFQSAAELQKALENVLRTLEPPGSTG